MLECISIVSTHPSLPPSPPPPTTSLGSDFWTEAEKSLFNASLGAYGKEFSLICKTVHPHHRLFGSNRSKSGPLGWLANH